MSPKPTLLALVWLIAAGIGSTLIVLAGVHLYLSPTLPSVDTLRDVRLQTPLRIYSYDGQLIGEIGEKRRTPVTYQSIPQGYIDALLSAEDDQFYSHNGVSIKGLMRASSQLLISGGIQGGGSTITMQVARNFFLTRRQEFKRKFNEILLALRIERELSKQEILELYVNVIFLGNRAYGIEAAANVYYGKTLEDLSLAQMAMIAGLPKAPSTMNPLANPERALTRRNWILSRMHELGKISDAEYQSATLEPISAKYRGSNLEVTAQYVAEMARKQAIEFFGQEAYTEGYNIYTTIQSDLQSQAQQAVIEGLLTYDQRHGFKPPLTTAPPSEVLALYLTSDDTGPEKAAKTEEASSGEIAPPEEQVSGETTEYDVLYKQWLEELQNILTNTPTYAELIPAAVVKVEPQSFKALTKEGEVVDIAWEDGIAQARKFITTNRRGAKPKAASDVINLGDIVRVRYKEARWHLTQIPEAQGALVSLDASNGAVLALVGGLDFNQSKFNRATQATRQPGSNFKPFMYTAALENGFTAATIINDAPIVFEDNQLETDWRPENSGGKFYGPTRLRKALYKSQNIVSVRVLQSLGIPKAIENLGRFGLNPEQMPRDLSLALGSHVMSPMDVVTGYAVFANGGYQVLPFFIDRIENAKGEVVFRSDRLTVCPECLKQLEREAAAKEALAQQNAEANETNAEETTDTEAVTPEPGVEELASAPEEAAEGHQEDQEEQLETAITPAPRVVDERIAYIMDSILKDVVTRGTATKAKVIQRSDIAGKTGTTNKATNAWFSGYGGGIVTTTWVGFDDEASLGAIEYGGTAALPIWIQYMSHALKGRPEQTLARPPGLVTTRIDAITGQRARPGSPNAIFEIFRSEYVPELESEDTADPQTPWAPSDAMGTESIF